MILNSITIIIFETKYKKRQFLKRRPVLFIYFQNKHIFHVSFYNLNFAMLQKTFSKALQETQNIFSLIQAL